MFVVNTTSATVVDAADTRLPRNRVPSSRRRNPGVPRSIINGYGFLVGACLVGGCFVFPGAGVSGTAGFGFACCGAGAATGAGPNVWSSTDLGAVLRVDISVKQNDRKRNAPPHHQLALVRRLPACRVPRNELVGRLAPPTLAATPPPG